uniref:FBA_2 domain-containing protein n=1 Tax=Steinernema glaseri TaxID=37863 RepID=A0A1I7ZZC7_9BILA
MINLEDGKKENVCREIVKRYPYATYQFAILSSSINETWVEFACSLKRLSFIVIKKKLNDDSVRLFQKLVTRQKLSYLSVCEKACEGTIQELLKSVLCQAQFLQLKLRIFHSNGAWNSAIVRTLLQHWADNSEKFNGKQMVLVDDCEGGVEQLEEFLLRRASMKTKSDSEIHSVLKVCSQEESDFVHMEYRNKGITFIKPSCVYKYEEGEQGERRRIYICFELEDEEEGEEEDEEDRITEQQNRPASHNGREELKLMRYTDYLHLLFA